MSQGFGDNNPYQNLGNFSPKPSQPAKKKSRSTAMILALLAGAGGVLVLLCCGGLGALGVFGLELIENEVADELRDNPTVREKLGEIESFEMDFMESMAEEDSDTYVFEVVGSKGSGTITSTSVSDFGGEEQVIYAELRMTDGETIVLVDEL